MTYYSDIKKEKKRFKEKFRKHDSSFFNLIISVFQSGSTMLYYSHCKSMIVGFTVESRG